MTYPLTYPRPEDAFANAIAERLRAQIAPSPALEKGITCLRIEASKSNFEAMAAIARLLLDTEPQESFPGAPDASPHGGQKSG